jgi:hypothetical protein
MRKILYSPGYGAGWTTWYSGSREEKLFMLEYKPFIEALEKHSTGDYSDRRKRKSKCIGGEEVPEFLPVEQFLEDWKAKFSSDPPYLGGLSDLEIYPVPDGTLVRIEEYDGYESVVTCYDDWL